MAVLFRMKQGMGKHYLRRGGKLVVVRPGETIRCEPWELKAGKEKFEQLEPDFTPQIQPKVGLKAVHAGGGRWNVINETTGKKINERTLTKEEALEMVNAPADQIEDEDILMAGA